LGMPAHGRKQMTVVEILMPVFLIITAGFALGKTLHTDVRPLSQLVLYVLTPCLIFSYLSRTQISTSEIFLILIFAFMHMLASIVVVGAMLYFARIPREAGSVAILSSLFMNSANYGLPVILFAFGNLGVERAVIFVLWQLLIFNTLGVFLGARAGLNKVEAICRVFKMPSFYALLLAAFFKAINFPLSVFLLKTVEMVGQSAIPVMMIVLGIQLSCFAGGQSVRVITGVTVFRLLVSPALAWLLLNAIMDVNNMTSKVLLVESAMPAAVNNVLLAIEFHGDERLASSLVLVTTVISFFTITILLWLLKV